jgi:hypothetical protein
MEASPILLPGSLSDYVAVPRLFEHLFHGGIFFKLRNGKLFSMDEDIEHLTKEELISEVKKLRAGIRTHRDSTKHELCWHHPQLWNLLPEKTEPALAVPAWPQFIRGCIRYRESLDRQLPDAPSVDEELSEHAERL